MEAGVDGKSGGIVTNDRGNTSQHARFISCLGEYGAEWLTDLRFDDYPADRKRQDD